MTLMCIELCLIFELGIGNALVVPWDPKRRAEETRQPGGHPTGASGFFLFLPFGNK